ncbi:MAG TPA: UvrB/UvrC motif-containing protein [Gemmatimonadales bacterium]|nr:UvrB/UvrC motif-containing protein [Gemmatimonadales bacterium]
MRCERCGEREAVVHLHQVADGEVAKVHLCEPCAAEQGITPAEAIGKTPLGQLVAALGKPVEAGAEGLAACPGCGAALEDFRATGRLGCAECWEAFAGPLRGLLRRLHGATHHRGEQYLAEGGGPAAADALARELRARLQAAVAEENFELAAELRDRLQGLP